METKIRYFPNYLMISNKTFMEFRTFCFKFPTLKQISLKICQANFKDLLTRYPEIDTNAMGFPIS